MRQPLSDDELGVLAEQGAPDDLKKLQPEELQRLGRMISSRDAEGGTGVREQARSRKAKLEAEPPIEEQRALGTVAEAGKRYGGELLDFAKQLPDVGNRLFSGEIAEDVGLGPGDTTTERSFGNVSPIKGNGVPTMSANPPKPTIGDRVRNTLMYADAVLDAGGRELRFGVRALTPGTGESQLAGTVITNIAATVAHDAVALLSRPGTQLREHPGHALQSALDLGTLGTSMLNRASLAREGRRAVDEAARAAARGTVVDLSNAPLPQRLALPPASTGHLLPADVEGTASTALVPTTRRAVPAMTYEGWLAGEGERAQTTADVVRSRRGAQHLERGVEGARPAAPIAETGNDIIDRPGEYRFPNYRDAYRAEVEAQGIEWTQQFEEHALRQWKADRARAVEEAGEASRFDRLDVRGLSQVLTATDTTSRLGIGAAGRVADDLAEAASAIRQTNRDGAAALATARDKVDELREVLADSAAPAIQQDVAEALQKAGMDRPEDWEGVPLANKQRARNLTEFPEAPNSQGDQVARYIRDHGGIWDDALREEVRMAGENYPAAVGMIKKSGVDFDTWAERLASEFPQHFPDRSAAHDFLEDWATGGDRRVKPGIGPSEEAPFRPAQPHAEVRSRAEAMGVKPPAHNAKPGDIASSDLAPGDVLYLPDKRDVFRVVENPEDPAQLLLRDGVEIPLGDEEIVQGMKLKPQGGGEAGRATVGAAAGVAARAGGALLGAYAGSKIENDQGIPMTIPGAIAGAVGGHMFVESFSNPRFVEALKGTMSIGGREANFEEVTRSLVEPLLPDRTVRVLGQDFNPRRSYLRIFAEDKGLPPDVVAWRKGAKARAAARQEDILDLGRKIEALNEDQRNAVESLVRGKHYPGSVTDEVRTLARQWREVQDGVSLDAIEAGMAHGDLAQVIRDNMGTYVPRLFLNYERQDALGTVARWLQGQGEDLSRMSDLSYFKTRKDLPADVRKALGEISAEHGNSHPGYLLARRAGVMAADVEYARFSNWLASSPDYTLPRLYQDNPIQYGARKFTGAGGKNHLEMAGVNFRQMPDNRRYGALRGRFVEENIAYDLETMHETASGVRRFLDNATAFFKRSKVVYNPASQARNVIGNGITADIVGGLSPARVDIYSAAVKDMREGRALYQEAREAGIFRGSFYRTELRSMRDSMLRTGNATSGLLDHATGLAKRVPAAMRKFSESAENLQRMALYRFAREHLQMDAVDAANHALKAGFDYSDVPRWIQVLRKSPVGAPFVTYSYKAMPRMLEAALSAGTIPDAVAMAGKMIAQGRWSKVPQALNVPFFRFWKYPLAMGAVNEYSARKLGYIKDDQKGMLSTLKRLALGPAAFSQFLPDYAGSLQVLLPWRDSLQRPNYFDATWTLPWGDVGELGKGPVGKVLGKAGIPFPRQLEPGNPWIQMLGSTFNLDLFTGDPIIQPESSGFLGVSHDYGKWLSRLWMPSLFGVPGMGGGFGYDKLVKSFQGQYADRPDVPTPWQALGSEVFGLKTRAVDPRQSYDVKVRKANAELRELKDRRRKFLIAGDARGAEKVRVEYVRQQNLFLRKYGKRDALPPTPDVYKRALEKSVRSRAESLKGSP